MRLLDTQTLEGGIAYLIYQPVRDAYIYQPVRDA